MNLSLYDACLTRYI